jgi:hypothetical protein
MSNSNLSTLSMSELKAIALELDCTLKGDKRSKQSWIDAIKAAQSLAAVKDSTAGKSDLQIATEVDIAMGLTELSDAEMGSIDYGDIPTPQNPLPGGAIAVFASILVAIIFLLSAIGQILATGIEYTYLLCSMFGRYNPDYDLWYQLQLLAEVRKPALLPSPA